MGLIKQGEFGWDDFFQPMVESITTGADFYLLANDFPSYIEAQVNCFSEAFKYTAELIALCRPLKPRIFQISPRSAGICMKEPPSLIASADFNQDSL